MTPAITAMPIKPPLVLHVVRAVLFVWGVAAAIGTVDGMLHGSFFIGIGVLNLFAGTAVLRGSRSWRLFVLGMLWYLFIGSGIGLLIISAGTGPVTFVLFGSKVATTSKGWVTSAILSMVVIGVWMHVALCLPKIRAYFNARPWPLVDPAVVRTVEQLEAFQRAGEHDVVFAQMGKLDKMISRLKDLLENLAGADVERAISEARNETNDLILRATRIRSRHFDKSEAP